MSNTKGNKVRTIFNSVLDQLNEKDDKAVEGPVGTVQGQQVRATQLSSDYLAKRRANLDKKRKAEGKPVKRHVYAKPENASTEVTYRDGIKALFESVLDEGIMKRAFMNTQDDSGDDGEAEAKAREEGEARATAAKADDAQKQYDAYKADQLRALTHGRKGVKLEKPKVNMGTSDKPKMKQLETAQAIRTNWKNILEDKLDK